VHIAVDGSEDVTGADVVQGSTPDDFFGVGVDPHGDGSRGLPIAPSSWSIGCYSGHRGIGIADIGSDQVVVVRVLDPDHLYKAWALDCDITTTTTIDVTGSVPGSEQNWDTMVADTAAAIPGLLPTDTVRDAGYPEGPGFKEGPKPVVIRNGSVIATLYFQELAAAGGSWSVDLKSCADSGLGEGTAIEPTATPAPSMAAVTCTADGTELGTPTVAMQSDGLHVDAKNEADATLIEIASDGSVSSVGVGAFDGADHREVVFDVPAGPAQIACRTPENGTITGGPRQYPKLFVPILILAPSG
jgi:hypothetical protein